MNKVNTMGQKEAIISEIIDDCIKLVINKSISKWTNVLGINGLAYIKMNDQISDLFSKIYEIDYSHVGFYYLNDGHYDLLYIGLFQPFVKDLGWQGPVKFHSMNVIAVSVLNLDSLPDFIQDHSKGLGEIQSLLNVSIQTNIHVDQQEYNIQASEMIEQIEGNLIETFRKTLYSKFIGSPLELNLFSQIFEKKPLYDQFISLKCYLDEIIYEHGRLDLNLYHQLSHVDHLNLFDKLILEKKILKNKSLGNEPQQIIKIGSEYEERIYHLHDQLQTIRDQIDRDETPRLNLNQMIIEFNQILILSKIERAPIKELNNKTTIGLIIEPSIPNDQRINLNLKKNQKVVISAKNPDLNQFTHEQLKEILISLDIYTSHDPSYDDIKRQISNRLTNK